MLTVRGYLLLLQTLCLSTYLVHMYECRIFNYNLPAGTIFHMDVVGTRPMNAIPKQWIYFESIY